MIIVDHNHPFITHSALVTPWVQEFIVVVSFLCSIRCCCNESALYEQNIKMVMEQSGCEDAAQRSKLTTTQKWYAGSADLPIESTQEGAFCPYRYELDRRCLIEHRFATRALVP